MRVGGLFPITDGQGVIPSDVFMITAKEYTRVIFPSLYQSSASSKSVPRHCAAGSSQRHLQCESVTA
jgi:hypothetical protein